jgi:hypothetical protein
MMRSQYPSHAAPGPAAVKHPAVCHPGRAGLSFLSATERASPAFYHGGGLGKRLGAAAVVVLGAPASLLPSLSARHLLSSLGGPATLPSSLSAGRRRVSPRLTAVPGVSLARARETTRRTRHRGHTDARDASACTMKLHLPRRWAACACHSATSLCLRSLRRQRQRRRTARDIDTRAPLGATGGAADPQALTDGAAGGAADCLRRLRTAPTHCSEYTPRQPLDSEPHAPHQRETGGGRRHGERADAARDTESEQRQPETWRP